MITRKYTGDYRLENVLDAGGNLKTVPVYRGPYFRFCAPAAEIRRTKLRLMLLILASSAALLLALILPAPVLQRLYSILPLVLCLLPTVLLWQSIWTMFRAGEKARREDRDRICDGFAAWSLVLLILSALSIVGQIIGYCLGDPLRDLPTTGLTCAIAVFALLAHRSKGGLAMGEIREYRDADP